MQSKENEGSSTVIPPENASDTEEADQHDEEEPPVQNASDNEEVDQDDEEEPPLQNASDNEEVNQDDEEPPVQNASDNEEPDQDDEEEPPVQNEADQDDAAVQVPYLEPPKDMPNTVYVLTAQSANTMMARMSFATDANERTWEMYRGFIPIGIADSNVAIKKALNNEIHILQMELNCLAGLRAKYPAVYPPNLVKLIGLIKDHRGGFNGLVLSYIPGKSLHDNLHKEINNKIPWDTRVTIIRDIFRGLKAILDSGYIFQDLKTHDVWLDENKHGILTDLGSLCSLREPTNYEPLIHGYRDPEYLSDPDVPRQHHEIYSLGVIIFEIILGENAKRNRPEMKNLPQEYKDVDPKKAQADGRLGTAMSVKNNKEQFEDLFEIAQFCCLPKNMRLTFKQAERMINKALMRTGQPEI